MKRSLLSSSNIVRGASLFGIILLCAVILSVGFLGKKQASAAPLLRTSIVANTTAQCNHSDFFGLEPWYHFLPDEEVGIPQNGSNPAEPCGIRCFNIFVQTNKNDCNQSASDVPGVILAVIDDLLRIAGLVAVAFILVGSFQYVGSRGNPEKTAAAQSTVISALTGLAISLIAVALVTFIGHTLQ